MNRNAKFLTLIASTAMVAGCGTDAKLQVRPVGAQAVLPVDDLLAQGRMDFALNNVALALDQFRRAERLQPTNVSALNGIAACYDRLGRFDLSRLYYEKALALAPTDSKTRHNFALSLTMQGRTNEALALARETAPQPMPTMPRPVATPAETTVTDNGSQSVTVALPPPPPAPVVVPHAVEQRASAAAAPADRLLPGPYLERLSLGEVELVTVQPSKTQRPMERQARIARSRPAERVVKVAQAKLVKQTSTSSEWVFPEAPAKSVASVASTPAQPNAPKVVVAAAAEPVPAPVEKPAPAAPPAVLAPQVQLAVMVPSAPLPIAAAEPAAVPAPPQPPVSPSRPARSAISVQLASAAAIPVAATPPLAADNAARAASPPAPAPRVQSAVVASASFPPVAATQSVSVPASPPRASVKPSQPARPVRPVQMAIATAVSPAKAPILATARIAVPVAAAPPRSPAKPLVLATPIRTERKPTRVSTPHVRVLNAVGRKGLAGRYSHYLQARGWSGLRTADARHTRAMTVIIYPAGARGQAAALARRLPFRATLAASRSGSDMLVLLGNDALAFDNRLRLRVSRA